MALALTEESIAAEVTDHPFLRGLSPGFLHQISLGAMPRSYGVGEFLLREGDEADHLFLVCSGKVALEVGPPDRQHLTIETVGPGAVVGWSWSVAPRRYELDARAVRPVRAIAIDAEVVRSACDAAPSDGYRFLGRLLSVVADRLANTRLQLVDAQRD